MDSIILSAFLGAIIGLLITISRKLSSVLDILFVIAMKDGEK